MWRLNWNWLPVILPIHEMSSDQLIFSVSSQTWVGYGRVWDMVEKHWVFLMYAAVDYPWNDIDGKHRTALKKWLFLTDYPQILDKNILYGMEIRTCMYICHWSILHSLFLSLSFHPTHAVDFLVYILLCLQIYNFRPWREVDTRLTDFLRTESLINSLKVTTHKH